MNPLLVALMAQLVFSFPLFLGFLLLLLVLFLLVFHLHVVHDRIEKSITELVRYDALRNLLKNEGRTDVTGTHG